MPAAAADDEWEPPAREAGMGEIVSMEELRVQYAPEMGFSSRVPRATRGVGFFGKEATGGWWVWASEVADDPAPGAGPRVARAGRDGIPAVPRAAASRRMARRAAGSRHHSMAIRRLDDRGREPVRPGARPASGTSLLRPADASGRRHRRNFG
jgi:hypothetical protein